MDSIGFIGLGAMGFPMTKQLDAKLPATTTIYVNDVVTEQVDLMVAQSLYSRVRACSSATEVANKSQVIVTMLPEGKHVRDVYLDKESGLLKADLAQKLMIDCSTIDVETSKIVAEQVKAKHTTAKFFDAPVSGGVAGALKGSLTFMVGCQEDDVEWERIKKILEMMGTSIFACGGPTLGLVTKFCNNYLSGTIAIAASEAMNIGIRSGLNPVKLSEVFKTSTAQNAILDKFHPVPGVDPSAFSSHGYQGGFKVQLMCKDYSLAIQAAKSVGARVVLGEAGLATYEGASNDPRCMNLDSRVVYRYIGGIEDWAEREKK